ncbi:MAG TPA: SpoIID/LytB domain-containing protein, partial [Candidatus Lustribacter sp.]|nr:SpoIID/LytB domain-containing protein [Candidatus Lustribacter sp.]
AYGAATRGLSWRQIMAFYYPATTVSAAGNPSVRVRVSALGGAATTVVAAPGLTFTDGASTRTLVAANGAGVPIDRWRVIPDAGGMTLQWRTSGVWTSSTYWHGWTRSSWAFSTPAGSVRVELPTATQRSYRGQVRTYVAGTSILPVNVVNMESYLPSVVPAEMPASWAAGGLQSQAVAARTYAAYRLAHPLSSLYHLCDTTSCQVYHGAADYTSAGALAQTWEDARTNAAITATSGAILTYGGTAALTEFSASNGGMTAAGSAAYLVAKADPYDAAVVSTSNPSSWSATLSLAQIEAAYPTIGTLKAISVPSRTRLGAWGGRMSSVQVVGTAATVTTTGSAFRAALGLKSEWWTMGSAPQTSAGTFPKDLTSDGLADLVAVDTAGALKVLKYSGQMSFSTITAGTSGWSSMSLVTAVGPFDSDNRGDVLARSADGVLWLYRGGDTGVLYQSRTVAGLGWGGANLLVPVGDFNGDGHPDVLARGNDGALLLYSGNGSGKFTAVRAVSTGWQVYASLFSPGDLTGDGVADLVGVKAADGAVLRFPGTGSGTLGPGTRIGNLASASTVWGVGDLTGDGRPDLVARRRTDGALLIYPVMSTGTLDAPIALGTTWASYPTWAR